MLGTLGQLTAGAVALVETIEQAETFAPKDSANLALVTQTTLSVDDTAAIVATLQGRFPASISPHKEDICYATTNRQLAVKKVAPMVDAMIVVGSPNSSNSQRLREVAVNEGCPRAMLIDGVSDLDWQMLDGVARLGITAGASVPELLIEQILDTLAEKYALSVDSVSAASEDGIFFQLPRSLRYENARAEPT